MGARNGLDDAQAKARSGHALGAHPAHEAAADPLNVLRGDALPPVAHPHARDVPFDTRPDSHLSALRRVLDGVLRQLQPRLRDAGRIEAAAGVRRGVKDPVAIAECAGLVHDGVGERRQIDGRGGDGVGGAGKL